MIWDRFIRAFHWCFASGVLLNYLLLEGGDDSHEWLGYGLVGLVLIRVVWGFIGPSNAQFSHFLVGPRRLISSIRRFSSYYRPHRGHSPLAGWMVIFLLSCVVLLGLTGWMQGLDMFWGEDWLQILHEYLGHALIFASLGHVVAVLLIQHRYRIPLIQSMLWKPITKQRIHRRRQTA